MNIEKKEIYLSKENEVRVKLQLDELDAFGWIIESRNYDNERRVEHITLSRDLSSERNKFLKEMQDDYDDVVKARMYCDLNSQYCERLSNDCSKKAKIKKGFLVFLLLLIILCVALLCVFKFTDILTQAVFTLNGEKIEITKDFVYNMPDGKTFFGLTSITYNDIINFTTIVFGGIALLLGIIFICIFTNQTFKKKIMIAESKWQKNKSKEYLDLYDKLSKWNVDDVRNGRFDPFNSIFSQ